MKDKSRRYVFIDYENLKRVKVKQLRQACNRVFVFVNASETDVPLPLVLQMQRIGKGVRWIPIKQPIDNNMNFHICFFMGLLHRIVDKDIEFAVLSNEKHFDPLIQYIDSKGRSCIRVKRGKKKQLRREEIPAPPQPVEEIPETPDPENGQPENPETPGPVIGGISSQSIIQQTARQTIKRLIRSGKRPGEMGSLKKYILLHNQEMTVQGNIEKIINHLLETKEIQVKDNQVSYSF